MTQSRTYLAALLALLAAVPALGAAPAKNPPLPIATIANRRVEAADIQRAALVMADDPLRSRDHAAWRNKLLDLCVDRELLAMEAERAGFLERRGVRLQVDRASADILYGAIRDRDLIPAASPSATQIDTARAGGLFRKVKLAMILSLTDKETTYKVFEQLKHGARFDSIAALYSVHPSSSHGGEVGWKHVGELNASSWREFQHAKPGDIMGPYVNDTAHEFYRVEAIQEPTDQDIKDVMMRDRLVEMESRYDVGLLQKYHFKLNPDAVSPLLFTCATEDVDSILASLDGHGRRPKRDIHPALDWIAAVDGDTLDYRDIEPLLHRSEDGKARLEDSRSILRWCTVAELPRLVVRDARERGVDRDPGVARKLNLIREECSTRAMVAEHVPPVDSTSVRAWFREHASTYRRPAGRRAFVALFAAEDTARAALTLWSRKAARDSIFVVEGFLRTPNATVGTLFARRYGEISAFETASDPLSEAVRGLKEGQISPLIPTLNGYAIAEALGPEPARAYTFDEVELRARTEAQENAENVWVVSELTRLRAATPARTMPARLEAVRIGTVAETGGNRR